MNQKTRTLQSAENLVGDFSRRTGITGEGGDLSQRYLWTDAFAVQSLFGLAHETGKEEYHARAMKLVHAVHRILGRHRKDDPREGWISGLSEEEGQKHPTIGGLRIGKKLPERKPDEPVNERLEWERDGQYFHYLTRWVKALLQAAEETGQDRYAVWAAELMKAGSRFVVKNGTARRMYWKMSIDLSYPLVSGMGAHDPLEGLICARAVLRSPGGKVTGLKEIARDFEELCAGRDWLTTDPLGIGGLMLNAVKSAVLWNEDEELPRTVHPRRLYNQSLEGLQSYATRSYNAQIPAGGRLAFRECGMTLGFRVLSGLRDHLRAFELPVDDLDRFGSMVEEIEEFWMQPGNQKAASWSEHLDINSVALASSLVATFQPDVFTGMHP